MVSLFFSQQDGRDGPRQTLVRGVWCAVQSFAHVAFFRRVSRSHHRLRRNFQLLGTSKFNRLFLYRLKLFFYICFVFRLIISCITADFKRGNTHLLTRLDHICIYSSMQFLLTYTNYCSVQEKSCCFTWYAVCLHCSVLFANCICIGIFQRLLCIIQ